MYVCQNKYDICEPFECNTRYTLSKGNLAMNMCTWYQIKHYLTSQLRKSVYIFLRNSYVIFANIEYLNQFTSIVSFEHYLIVDDHKFQWIVKLWTHIIDINSSFFIIYFHIIWANIHIFIIGLILIEILQLKNL